MKNEVKHTAHSSYRCQYHIVFAPKYRRKVIANAARSGSVAYFDKIVRRSGIVQYRFPENTFFHKKVLSYTVFKLNHLSSI